MAAKTQDAPKDWLTTKDVCRILNKTPMMVYIYRHGTCKTTTALPYYVQERGQRHSVLYKVSDVRAWAKKNGFAVEDSAFQPQ